jgi:DNA mismatch repair protein MutS2
MPAVDTVPRVASHEEAGESATRAPSERGQALTSELAPPDLLSATPSRRLDPRRAREVLTFAFAQGVADDAFDELLAAARLPDSTWDPAGFAPDLFVRELVAAFATVTTEAGGRCVLGQRALERLLSHPPTEPAHAALRREVLRTLVASDGARRDVERLHALVRALREQLGVAPVRSVDVLRRRLEILGALRALIDAAASAFEGHGSPAPLARVSRWASAVKGSDGYRALAELLDYDEHLATIDVRVRVGSDGRVRSLALTSVRENTRSRFSRSPVARWFARLSLLFRGYRFAAEELLARAVEQVFEGLEDVVLSALQLGADLEVYLFALSLRAAAERAGLAVSLPTVGEERRLQGLFNPLLLGHVKRVVPCDLVDPRTDRVVLVTGPNSGGKTRLLQAIGLAQLLGQCGLFVPAASAMLRPVDGLFVSFGAPPSANASEGRLGTELLRVRAVFETICVGGMVLVDELCSGTNPSEGEELFRHVVELLLEVEPQAFLSTHFLTAAADLVRAPPSERLAFLKVDIDENGMPTYRFVPGVAKTSLAHQTAARLGVTRDDLAALVARARRARRG